MLPVQNSAAAAATLPMGGVARLDVKRLAALGTVNQWAGPDSRAHQRSREVRMLQGVAGAAQNHYISRVGPEFWVRSVWPDVVAVQVARLAAFLAPTRLGNPLRNHFSRPGRALRYPPSPRRVTAPALFCVLAGVGTETRSPKASRAGARDLETGSANLTPNMHAKARLARPELNVAGHRASRWVLSDLAQIALKGLGADRASEASNFRSVLSHFNLFSAGQSLRHGCHRYYNRTVMSMREAV